MIPQKETLGKKQERFSRMVMLLLQKAFELGYDVRLGHALRCPDCYIGRKTSLHKLKLAIDLNLFLNGVYLSKTSDHAELGEYWESLAPDATWGGRFNDGNHYSLRHNGRR